MSQVIAQKVQEITVLEQAMGVKNVQIHLSQSQQFNSGRFGVILSANSPGLVISVAPNSQAHNLGIQSGDQIISVNGTGIAGNLKSALAILQYAENETGIEIVIRRHDKLSVLTGVLTPKLTPSWVFNSQGIQIEQLTDNTITDEKNSINEQKQQCGQIKIGFRVEAGQKARSLSTVVVVEAVDGVKVESPLDQRYLKIPVGYHKLTVYRKIHHRNDKRENSEEFRIRIDANTSYSLAYRRDTLFSHYSQKYAELPVIWKTKHKNCEM
jgi:hypothetical protein